MIYALFYNNVPEERVAFSETNLLVTGSTVEYSAICRTLATKKIDIELDHLYCLGQINENVASNVLSSVTDHPGFFRVRPIIFESVFSSLKRKKHLRV